MLLLGASPVLADGAAPKQCAVRILQARSGRCVGLDRPAVCQKAEDMARQQLLTELGRLAEELTGRTHRSTSVCLNPCALLVSPHTDRDKDITDLSPSKDFRRAIDFRIGVPFLGALPHDPRPTKHEARIRGTTFSEIPSPAP